MTPMAQVGHVLMKDLREHRVRVALFATLVLVALARALGAPVPVDSNVLSILVLLTGIAIVAAPVESDPPADARSFWAPRPLAPGAVVVAKLAFGALIVLVAALAQAVGAWSLDLHAAQALRYVTGPAQLFALLLLATLVVAAASSDGRARLLLVFGLLLGFIAAAARLVAADPVSARAKEVAIVAAGALMVAALAYFYLSRRSGWVPLAVALLVLALGGVAATRRTAPLPLPPVGPEVPRAEIHVAIPAEAPVVHRGAVRVRLSAEQPVAGWQYSIRNPVLLVTLGSGRTIRLTGDLNFMNLGGDPGPMPAPPAVEAARAAGKAPGFREVGVRVPPDLLVAEGDTIREVTLSGTVLVTALRVVDTIAVAMGSSHARRGVRSIVDSVTMVDGRPEIVIRAEGLVKPEEQARLFPFASYFGRSYTLLGASGDRMPMRQTWRASSSGGLVLPSGAFGSATLRLEPIDPAGIRTGAAGDGSDRAWMHGARLLAIEPTLRGQYPVTLEWTRSSGR